MKNTDKILKLIDELGIIKTSEMLTISPIELINQLGIDIKTIDDINFKPFEGGVAGSIMFDNRYGVSVVSHKYSYGGDKGLFEMAILDSEGNLTYGTDITSDVIGYLTPEEVTKYMIKVQDLKS